MRRRLTAGAVVTATGLAFLTTVPTAATAAPSAPTDYTVVAADGVSAADAAAAVTAAGGTIVRPIFAFPGGRRFQFLDPAGNELACVKGD